MLFAFAIAKAGVPCQMVIVKEIILKKVYSLRHMLRQGHRPPPMYAGAGAKGGLE
jgi:hypothetical protein